MSLPPSMRPGRIIDQNFGMCITPNDFIWPFYNTYSTNYFRPWNWYMQDIVQDFGSTIDNQRDSFKVTLDVQHFRPNEVTVKVVNNHVLVEGRHEERRDEHGFVARQFMRRYPLPENCLAEDVISNLSSDGVLTVIARKKSECEFKKNEKIVPIKLCKSCPLKEQINIISKKDDTKQETEEIKKVDAAKKNTQIMLKEDHCCLLLKPELLRDAAADNVEIRTETKQKEGQEQMKAKQVGIEQVTNTSQMLQESVEKSKGKSKQSCEKSKSAISESAGILEQSCGKSSAISTSAEITEQVCSKTSGAVSTSAGLMETCSKTTTAETLEQTTGQSSAASVLRSEKVGHCSTTMSEMSEQTAMSSKTSEIFESSTSYKSSMESSLREMSEELSDFVCDILCSELGENKDIKK